MSVSEPNTLLEINEAHADNFMLVIPKLPTSEFLGSVFNGYSKPSAMTTGTTGTSGDPEDCDAVQGTHLRREQNLDLANFKLYISDVAMPGVNITKYEIGTQFATLSRAAKINFTDLTTTMLVSENFLNYNILLYWMYALHNPQEYNKISGRAMTQQFFTDIYLIVTNNHREKVAEFKFLDAFPISLPSVPFSFKNADKISLDVGWAHSGMYPTDNFVLKYI